MKSILKKRGARIIVTIFALLIVTSILSGVFLTSKPAKNGAAEPTTTAVEITDAIESTTLPASTAALTVTDAPTTTKPKLPTTTAASMVTTTSQPKASTTTTSSKATTITTTTILPAKPSANADKFRSECRNTTGRVLCIDSRANIMGAFVDGKLVVYRAGIGLGCPATPTSKGWFSLFFPGNGWGKYRGSDKAWWSEEFDVWMPYFVGIDASRGIGTHFKAGSGCSHGCVRNTSLESAKAFYYALYPGGKAFVY